GEIGQDAFGNVPYFEDRGIRRRALLALGRQDVDPEGLIPLEPGIEILGASSDHLICDIEDAALPVEVGSILEFKLTYSALLRASSSPYVTKRAV
ncbi:MAG TPA: alanine/ornithine racemase family PLP-dependent enzyme, partial [Bacillota bacterium]|nr:alanine/ornithine racemase family PLP-dependent enzyme [Bacillota bacterium]